MRELKFRAWDKGNSTMFFGIEGHLERFDDEMYQIMQFTGLKDKNGKEIYEGDIFQDEEDGSCEFVEWDNDFGGWSTQAWYSVGEFTQAIDHLEVIGNIYENPELLKA